MGCACRPHHRRAAPRPAQPAGRSRPPSQPVQSGAAGGTAYLVNGLRAKDIADLLEISPKTVDTYRASLMRKLNVHDLVGLGKSSLSSATLRRLLRQRWRPRVGLPAGAALLV